MFVIIIKFPKLEFRKEQDFINWFESSNQKFQKFPVLISRILLKPIEQTNDDQHVIIMKFKDKQSYVNLHSSDMHKNIFLGLMAIIDDIPRKRAYQIISKTNSNLQVQ